MPTIETALDPSRIVSSERLFIAVASLLLLFHAALYVGDSVSRSSSQSIAQANPNPPSPGQSPADIAVPTRVDPVVPVQAALPPQNGKVTGIVSDDRARRLARKTRNASPVSADDQNAVAAPNVPGVRAQRSP